MKEQLWTVVRFPAGDWSCGGRIDDPDYAECEKWQIVATSGPHAVMKAQARRRYRLKKQAKE